jgi:hypothetical protein
MIAGVAPGLVGVLINLLGFLTGTALYAMLVAMVWRERSAEGHVSRHRA